jgi:hypothetical protein
VPKEYLCCISPIVLYLKPSNKSDNGRNNGCFETMPAVSTDSTEFFDENSPETASFAGDVSSGHSTPFNVHNGPHCE